MQLIESFVRNPVKVAVGVLLVSLFGILAMISMPMQLIPEVQTPTLSIATIWPGASPQEVERVIIQEQEKQLKSVEGVSKMTSESMDSMGQITLEFPVGTDMSTAEIKVNSRLQQVPFYPADVKEPVITTSNAADRPIAWFILMQRTASVEDVKEMQEKYPETAEALKPVLAARNSGLRNLRLKKAAEQFPVLKSLIPERVDVTTLRKFAEDFIEAKFETVPGVSNSNVLGGREEEVQVVVNPEKLAARELTINDLRQALRTQNKDSSGGDFWEQKRRYSVRTLGQFRSIDQVDNVIVARRNGIPVYVHDIAEVEKGHKKPDGFVARFGSSCIAVNCQRSIGANVLDVQDRLKEVNDQLNNGLLKQQGLELMQVYDETEYIYSARKLVVDNLVEGAVLTFITLLLFLRNGRSTIIIFIHIIVSTIGAFLMMKLLGRSLNVPALGGLAFAVGMLVDNAIVMLENIFRRWQLGDSPLTASVRGASEVTGALLNATIANLVVFLPILMIKEEAGQLFRDIALAISASVGFSMIVAITVVPTAAMRLLKAPEPGKNRLADWVTAPHALDGRAPWVKAFWAIPRAIWQVINRLFIVPMDAMAGWFVDLVVGFNRGVMTGRSGLLWRIGMMFLFVGGGVWLTYVLTPKVEYLPTGNRNLVMGILIPPPGYNLKMLEQMGQDVEQKLLPYFDVDPGSPEAANLKYPIIEDFFFVARSRSVFMGIRAQDPNRVAELVPLLQTFGADLPGTFVVAKQSSLFEQNITGGRTIEIEITGPELSKLVEIGGRVLGQCVPHPEIDPATGKPVIDPATGQPKMTQLIPGAQAIPRPSLDLSNPEVHVTPRWEQAADLRMTADELGYAVDALVDGAYATDFYSGGDRIDLRIMGDTQFASRTQDLESLPIAMPTGQLLPLSAVADVRLSSGPEQINHRTRQRSIRIEVTPPANYPLETAMQVIEKEIREPLQRDQELIDGGYRVELAGTADKLVSTWNSMRDNFLLAVLVTYLMMAATFESWLFPFVVMLTIPLGAVGGFMGLSAMNYFLLGRSEPPSLDVLTMLGFFMLVGTVVNNPILIVEQSIANIRETHMPVADAILESLRDRIRPIFMTTLSGLAGLLPLVIAPGAGSELYRGIGAVLLGGMVISTILTLVFVPASLSLMLEIQAALVRLLGWERKELAIQTSPTFEDAGLPREPS
ncbi:MAG: efflux RND transporter permease subunit [Planctomycetota bacterium]|nr:efflux RND transporter permease subunit [Planctomycetota bacterium]